MMSHLWLFQRKTYRCIFFFSLYFFLLSVVLSYLPQNLFAFAKCLCCSSTPIALPWFVSMMYHVLFVCKEQEVAPHLTVLSVEVSSRSPKTILGSETV